jgi:hypothetical protein
MLLQSCQICRSIQRWRNRSLSKAVRVLNDFLSFFLFVLIDCFYRNGCLFASDLSQWGFD